MTSAEIINILRFTDGDVEEASKLLRDLNIKAPLAGPPRKKREGESGAPVPIDFSTEPLNEDLKILSILMDGKSLTGIKEEAESLQELRVKQSALIELILEHELAAVSLPSQIQYFVNLKELNCSDNQLTSLPAEIGQLSQLQVLDCSFNYLTSLSKEIGQLSQLQVLNCSRNRLTLLPKEIGDLSKLTYLDCSQNQLTSLPLEIGKLVKLITLETYYNPFYRMPLSIGRLRNTGEVRLTIHHVNGVQSEKGMIDYRDQFVENGLFAYFKFSLGTGTNILGTRNGFYAIRDIYDAEKAVLKKKTKRVLSAHTEENDKGQTEYTRLPKDIITSILEVLWKDFENEYVVLEPGPNSSFRFVLEKTPREIGLT